MNYPKPNTAQYSFMLSSRIFPTHRQKKYFYINSVQHEVNYSQNDFICSIIRLYFHDLLYCDLDKGQHVKSLELRKKGATHPSVWAIYSLFMRCCTFTQFLKTARIDKKEECTLKKELASALHVF